MNRPFSRRLAAALALALVLIPALSFAGEDGWVPLFDGKTLDGWIQRGGKALYTIEDGVIVGSSVPNTPNSFLCTEKTYGDFILELELNVDAGLNSGVQIRSESFHDYKSWRVHGYQVEIDPSARAWSGGIYDEARRGWLNSLDGNEEAQKAFQVGKWNTYRVQAIGDSIQTWVNGVPAADLVDSLTLEGFIALQVHGTNAKETKRVRWRNIRIQDLGRHRWKPLFDSATLKGWQALPGGRWEARDGMIVGTSTQSEARHGLLLSEETFGDFTAHLKFRAIQGNSGFYFRSEKVSDGVGVHGFQAEIDPTNDVGGLYETGGRAWVVQPTPEQVQKWLKPGEWNDMTVSAHGRRIVVHVNGQKTAELKDDPGRLKGHLALQLHGGQDMDVAFKDIAILVPEKDSDAVDLFDGKSLEGWKTKGRPEDNHWIVGAAKISTADAGHLVAEGSTGDLVNVVTEHGQGRDVFSTRTFGDCRIELQVMVPRGSNSGVYVAGEYEVQVLDSFGREKLNQGDMGAVYGASPPPINASKKPGQWQQYVIEYRAPRFGTDGKKVENAQLVSVMLNGHVIHHGLELQGATPGGVSRREAPTGPLMFQGNHGPVAYRNIRVFPR